MLIGSASVASRELVRRIVKGFVDKKANSWFDRQDFGSETSCHVVYSSPFKWPFSGPCECAYLNSQPIVAMQKLATLLLMVAAVSAGRLTIKQPQSDSTTAAYGALPEREDVEAERNSDIITHLPG